eukprot:COSAG06_NODE_57192_length_281_cov_0.851648_1_plen_67_part_10
MNQYPTVWPQAPAARRMWQRVRWLYLVESGSLVGRDAWRAIHVRCELNEHIGTRPELPMPRDDVFIS